MKRLLNTIFHGIFWIWNLTFLTVVYAGILPYVGIPLLAATFNGRIPIEFFLTLAVLILIPTACTIVGLVRLRSRPVELMRLFYGVEAPLFLLCLIRLFVLRELTPASTQIIGTIVVCIAAFLVEVLYGFAGDRTRDRGESAPTRDRAIAWAQLVCHSLMLLVGVYVGILLMFYAVPIAWVLVREFFKFQWLVELRQILTWTNWTALWWIPIFFLLFCFSSTLFLAMPSALASLYIQSGRRILLAFGAQYGKNRAVVGAGAVLTAWTIVFISLQQQPQIKAFKLLEKPVQNDRDRQSLLAKSNEIRSGLLNAYLADFRYVSSRKENDHIREMHKSIFGLSSSASQFLQDRYNQLMSPFLYNGDRSDSKRAEKLYEQFFDAPIQKAERPAVQHALQSTFNQDEVKAGLLNINQEKVWLRSQQVTVQPQGDWANVELYEVYENQTNEVQEIFYSFSLPESAVITGIWLGDTNNRAQRFPFVVSPRGAAQKVYTSQVRRERPIDPALLEQVGPRHYRLRAFPIPARIPSEKQQRQMHLWLTYKVMQQPQGWAMPQLGEKRNIFWNNGTDRIRNGKAIARQKDAWVESFLPASRQPEPALHQVNLPGGYQIAAKPISQDFSLPSSKRFAIVLDSSRSMKAHAKELAETFKWLKEKGFADNNLANNDADLYVTASPGAQPKRIDDISKFDPAMTFYGTIQVREMLQQFAKLRSDTAYDGILLVTDEGNYELSDDRKDVPAISAPLWMVHVGGKLPPAYDDATLKVIQDSGGGVSAKVPEVMQRLTAKTALGSSAVSVVDGYAWLVEKATGEVSANNGFEQIAARQLVLGLSKETDANKVVQLDAIHAIAKNFNIVTPYSSMLVLVNDEQRALLKKAESDSDRFDRKVESGKEELTKPSNPFNVSGVPEPEEWLLMGVTAIGLIFIIRRQRRTAKS